jgi:hypothetical protein
MHGTMNLEQICIYVVFFFIRGIALDQIGDCLRSITAEPRAWSWVSTCKIWEGQTGIEVCSSTRLSFFAVTVIQPVIYNFYVNPEQIEGYHAECGLWCVLLPFIEVVLSRPVLSCCDVLSLRAFCPWVALIWSFDIKQTLKCLSQPLKRGLPGNWNNFHNDVFRTGNCFWI